MLYLIKSGDYYKIGYTDNMYIRLKDYRTHNPDIHLIGMKEGTLEDESNYHKELSDYIIRGEWMQVPNEKIEQLKKDFIKVDIIPTRKESKKLSDFQKYKTYTEKDVNKESVDLKVSATGKRILKFIFDYLGVKDNKVIITTECCMKSCGFKNRKSIRDGIIELLDKNILTRSSARYQYWVNPIVMFNGDRIEFIREYRYEK